MCQYPCALFTTADAQTFSQWRMLDLGVRGGGGGFHKGSSYIQQGGMSAVSSPRF